MTTSALHRPIAIACVAAVVGSAGVAHAATRHRPRPKPAPVAPVCNLISDPAPDGFQVNLENQSPVSQTNGVFSSLPKAGQDPAMDIVTGDIATDAKNVTTVIRMSKGSPSSTNSPTGLQWQFTFSANGVPLFTSVTSDPANGVVGSYGYVDKTLGYQITGAAPAVVDPAKNEVRITVPLTAFAKQVVIKPGSKIDTLSATAGGVINLAFPAPVGPFSGTLFAGSMPDGETDTSTKSYVAGAPSCVTVGK